MPDTPLSSFEKISIATTVLLFVVLSTLSVFSVQHSWILCLALSMGGVGGLVHEIAQSGGKILFFQRQADGLYLGSAAGIVLGAVAGVLVVRGHLTGGVADENSVQLAYEVFIAGLALKGVVEAAGGNMVPDKS